MKMFPCFYIYSDRGHIGVDRGIMDTRGNMVTRSFYLNIKSMATLVHCPWTCPFYPNHVHITSSVI